MRITSRFGLFLAIALAGWALGPARALAGEWPQFRGPGGLGISEEQGLPVTWSADKNIVWKTELPGPGGSSPIVVGERVFLTCYTGYGVPRQPGDREDLKRHLLCLRRADGKLVWSRAVSPKGNDHPYEGFTTRHGYASSTAAADGQRVYVFFGTAGVLAFDHSGEQLWRADVGAGTHRYGSGTSPVLWRNLVIVNASVESEALVALDRANGKEVWRARGIREAWNTPLIVELAGGRSEVIVAIHGRVLAFDPASGQQLWSCSGTNDYMVPSAVAHDGIVYCLLGRPGTVLAIRAGGRGDVTNSHVLWRLDKGRNVASPVYRDGHLYFVTESLGIVRCLDAKTGEQVNERRLTPAAGDVYASLLVADGKLYLVSRERGSHVLAAKPDLELLAHNDLGDRSIFNASPAVAGGRLLLRSDRFLYCIGQDK